MKMMILSLLLMHGVFISIQAQTHFGTSAGTLGTDHSYFGYYAGNAAANSSADNSFFGANSGRNTTTASYNTAIGYNTLYNNTIGHSNTAVGAYTLYLNTGGNFNTATGRYALYSNTTGYYNAANGYASLFFNTTGHENTATGDEALADNTTGNLNVAAGRRALQNNTTGNENTATGFNALPNNSTGNGNSAYGADALTIVDGSYNSAFGTLALNSVCTGSYNTVFGASAGMALSGTCSWYNATALGYSTLITASNQVRIGNVNVTSIGGQVAWTVLSDGRFKKNIKNNVPGIEFINQLNPVSYALDKDAIDQFLGIPDSVREEQAGARKAPQLQIGFVAQEVDAIVKKSGYIFSGVETPDQETDAYTIRYDEFVVPLVKAVQELTDHSNEQQKEITELKRELGSDIQPIDVVLFQRSSDLSANSVQIEVALPAGIQRANVVISTLKGQTLKEFQVNKTDDARVKISGSEFSPGMYLYTLVAAGRTIEAKRLILTK
jgi:trimeric autotransporter adhesin